VYIIGFKWVQSKTAKIERNAWLVSLSSRRGKERREYILSGKGLFERAEQQAQGQQFYAKVMLILDVEDDSAQIDML
jgi:hypothetical protein